MGVGLPHIARVVSDQIAGDAANARFLNLACELAHRPQAVRRVLLLFAIRQDTRREIRVPAADQTEVAGQCPFVVNGTLRDRGGRERVIRAETLQGDRGREQLDVRRWYEQLVGVSLVDGRARVEIADEDSPGRAEGRRSLEQHLDAVRNARNGRLPGLANRLRSPSDEQERGNQACNHAAINPAAAPRPWRSTTR